MGFSEKYEFINLEVKNILSTGYSIVVLKLIQDLICTEFEIKKLYYI